MAKLTSKIAIPIILAGIFVITIFIALDYQNLDWTFYVVLLLLTLFVFFFGFAIGQSLTSPIRKLLARATDLSKGDLKTRVYLETKDELADLARVFNDIAEELEQSHQNQQRTEKSVDIKVRAKTQALEETINALEQKIKNRTVELQRIADDSRNVQERIQSREAEIASLKKQINDLKSAVGRSHFKKEPAPNEEKIV